jgi:hypothetical protein
VCGIFVFMFFVRVQDGTTILGMACMQEVENHYRDEFVNVIEALIDSHVDIDGANNVF